MENPDDSFSLDPLANADARIRSILSPRWIKYPAAERILNRLEELLVHPKVSRMPNLLIVSETNNGKTVLMNRFCSLHQGYVTLGDEKVVRPVVSVQAPPQPDEKRFYHKLLDNLNVPYGISERTERLEKQAFHVMRCLDTRMLIIDEIHNLLAGSSSRQRAFRNVIKNMANELQIVIVAVGTVEARNAMGADAQTTNRFPPKVLPKWHCDEDYQRLLASFEQTLPLRKASNLAEPILAERIFTLSEGTIGEISTVITLAAVEAIRSGEEHINCKVLDRIDYVAPSARRRMQ